jgi:hypothetical protein
MAVVADPREQTAIYVIHQVGVDQIRVVLSLSGDAAKVCEEFTEHDWRPRGMPNMRFVWFPRREQFKSVFKHFLGDTGPKLLYHRDSASLHVDVHFERLVAVGAAVDQTRATIAYLADQKIASSFPVRVARADFTGDVLFRSSAYYRYVTSAFRAMLCSRGRVVDPYRASTLYLNASNASKTKRLGRIYDKGCERAERGEWGQFPRERYMRIEAEQVWEANRPALDSLTPDDARRIFLDRFGSVGHGRLVLKGGLVEPLMTLLHDGAITVAEYERLYAFLDHCRMGLAAELYGDSRGTYHRRANEVRSLGLDVPGLDDEPLDTLDPELDARALVSAIAEQF